MLVYRILVNRVLKSHLFRNIDKRKCSESKQNKILKGNKMSNLLIEEKINLVKDIYMTSVNAVKAKGLIVDNKFFDLVKKDNGTEVLHVNDIESLSYVVDITNKNIHLIGFGKAVYGLAVQIARILGNRIKSGIVSIPVGSLKQFKGDPDYELNNTVIKFIEGGEFNRPDENSVFAGNEIRNLAKSMTDNDILISLTTGGASALVVCPKEGISVTEKSNLIQKLSNLGANITEMNVVRIALSEIKGGKLCQDAINAHSFISLVLSDIIDNPIHLIGSGPCVPMVPTELSPIDILKKYNLWVNLDRHVVEIIVAAKEHKEEPLVNPNLNVHLIGCNKMAIDCALEKIIEYEYYPVFLSSRIDGDVTDVSVCYWKLAVAINEFIMNKQASKDFANQITEIGSEIKAQDNLARDTIEAINSAAKGIILVGGGECTVKVKGEGIGGRNQELALQFSYHCANCDGDTTNVLLLCAGTDGIDGPTEAAGAIGGSHIIRDYNKLDMHNSPSIEDFLRRNDSFTFYRNYKNGLFQINIGHTGTNVMDLNLLLFEFEI